MSNICIISETIDQCQNIMEALKSHFELVNAFDFISVFNDQNIIAELDIASYIFLIPEGEHSKVAAKNLVDKGVPVNRIKAGVEYEDFIRKYDIQKFDDDKRKFEELAYNDNFFPFDEKNINPCYSDYRMGAGCVDSHYFYLDILAANIILSSGIKSHFDIGSRIDGFVSHLLAGGCDVNIIDIRPIRINQLNNGLPKISFLIDDVTTLSKVDSGSINSLSSLHAIEHVGLGRYGDKLDPEGYKKAVIQLKRVLAKGGKLYFSVPIGKEQKLCFNAHRIFKIETVLNLFSELNLLDFYLINKGMIHEYTAEDTFRGQYKNNIGKYDCGLFIFSK